MNFFKYIFNSKSILYLLIFTGITIKLHAQGDSIYSEINKCMAKGDTVSAIRLHKEFASIKEIKASANPIVTSINDLASINLYLVQKEYEKCDSVFKELELRDSVGNSMFRAYYNEYLAKYYYSKKDLEKSLEYSLISQKNYEINSDTVSLINVLRINGLIYMNTLNFSKAEEIFNHILELSLKSNSNYGVKLALKSLGAIYLRNEELDKSLDVYLKLKNKYQLSQREKALVFQNISSISLMKEDYYSAKLYADSSLIYNQELGDEDRIINAKLNLSKIALHDKQYDYAKTLLGECAVCYPDSGSWKEKIPIYYLYIELYSELNKKDSTLKYVQLYADSKNKAVNEQNQRSLLELSTKYATAQKDQEISLLHKQDEINDIKLKKQKSIIVLVTLLAILITGITVLINKQRKRLVKTQKALQHKQSELNKANDDLSLSNQAKDRILSVIGHDLRGPVGGLNSLIELYLQIPDIEGEDMKKLLKTAFESSSSTYMLLENLLTWANSQRGDINFKPDYLSVFPLVEQIVQLLDQSVNNKHLTFKIEVHPPLEVYADIDMFKSILRNLIGNSIKFSPKNSAITISASVDGDVVRFCVKDEGVGIDQKEFENIFSKKEAYFLENAKTGKGSGLGLILCKEFVVRHNGSIWVESEKGKGASFCFTLPGKQ